MLESLQTFFENLRKKEYYPYARAVLRGISQYIFYAFCLIFCAEVFKHRYFVDEMTQYLPHRELLEAVLLLLFAGLILNTTLLTFSIFDSVSRNLLMQSTNREADASDNARIREALLASRSFWIEFAVLVLLCFLFPLWYGYDELTDLIKFTSKIPNGVHRLLLTLIFGLTSFKISFGEILPVSSSGHTS